MLSLGNCNDKLSDWLVCNACSIASWVGKTSGPLELLVTFRLGAVFAIITR